MQAHSLVLVVLLSGCVAADETTTTEVLVNGNISGGAERPPDSTTGPTGGPAAASVAGFSGGVRIIEGVAGGPIEASRLGADCVGWVPGAPQYVLEVASPTDLSIRAAIAGDATLVVVLPNGNTLCNDDLDGLNPGVSGFFAAGRYPIFVGTYGPEGIGAPFRLTVLSATGMSPATHIPGAPMACAMTVPLSGSVVAGMRVVLGVHTPYTGPDADGGYATDDLWWNDAMWSYVGMEATVTEIEIDPVGCPSVRVDIDGGSWGWRIRDLGPVGGPLAVVSSVPVTTDAPTRPTPPFTGVAIPGVPGHCGMTIPDYGAIRPGMPVVLGAHTAWSGPDGTGGHVIEDTWWNEEMWAHVGRAAIVTELAGLDPVGCPYVRVDVDGGSWGWRIRDLRAR